MATAFARAVCEGCGWSIDQGTRAPMRADVDYDGAVTLDELYTYAARRVMWMLTLSGGDYAQTVRVSPEGDARLENAGFIVNAPRFSCLSSHSLFSFPKLLIL